MADYALPSSRSTNWTAGTYTGVIGGIAQYRPGGSNQRTTLIDITQSPYNADNTGATSVSSALQSAINAASTGQVVYMPAGTYKLSSGISIGANKKITLRGAGIGVTNLVWDGNVRLAVGSEADYQWNYPSSNNEITAGLTQGSTVITIADTSAFTAGKIIQLSFENQLDDTAIQAGATPVLATYGYRNMRKQKCVVVSKTSTTLTISPGIHHSPQSGLKAWVATSSQQSELVGLESFSADFSSSTQGLPIVFTQCYNCWVYNVKTTDTTNYHFYLVDSVNCEIRRSWFDGRQIGGSNGAALLMGASANCLIAHSIIAHIDPCVEINAGCCGNVLAYNVIEDGKATAALNTNHGAHNSHNLFEGNIFTGQQSDGYYGTASEDTWLRNWATGHLYTHASGRHAFVFNRFNRYHSLIGNIMGWSGYSTGAVSCGNPNMGNGFYDGTAEPTTGDFWNDWKAAGTLTTRTSDTVGVVEFSKGLPSATGQWLCLWWKDGGNDVMVMFEVTSISGSTVGVSRLAWVSGVLPAASTALEIWTTPAGYQELDLDVENTLTRKGNYVAQSAGGGEIPAGESLGSDTLPNSWSGGQPYDWPSGLTYPPFDPASPATSQDYTRLPAGSWFVNGYWPGEGSPTAPTITEQPTSQTVNAGDDVTLAVNASGNPAPTFQWKKGGTDMSGRTTRFLALLDVTPADDGSYTCVATNTEGSATSSAATLTVLSVGPPAAYRRRRRGSFGFAAF